MVKSALQIPEFLRVQLEVYSGLTRCATLISDVFCETYSAASTKEQISERTWMHRGLLMFLHELHTGGPVPETVTICDYFHDILTAHEDGLVRWTKLILAVFDSYALEGRVEVQERPEFKYYQNLRNALVELLINYYK